jgi:hypothetical protein
MNISRPIVHKATLRGTVSSLDHEATIAVNGLYEISTIYINGRKETVAFKVSGFGPAQIHEPLSVRTLVVGYI